VELASSTSRQKPPATYTRVNDFGPHTDSIFRGRLIRENELYASIYGRVLRGVDQQSRIRLIIIITSRLCLYIVKAATTVR